MGIGNPRILVTNTTGMIKDQPHSPLAIDPGDENHITELLAIDVELHPLENVVRMVAAPEELVLAARRVQAAQAVVPRERLQGVVRQHRDVAGCGGRRVPAGTLLLVDRRHGCAVAVAVLCSFPVQRFVASSARRLHRSTDWKLLAGGSWIGGPVEGGVGRRGMGGQR